MVMRNISQKSELTKKVIEKASQVSKDFFIVNHGSYDNTIEFLEKISKEFNINLTLKNEIFEGTMDDMKWKYYKNLRKKYWNTEKYILILDWDEVLDDILIYEINNIKFDKDVYLINRHTYFIKKSIDKNAYLPLLFEINSVEIAAFEKFHKLYNIKSKNIKKLKWILHHYSYWSCRDLINKNIYYAENEAKDLFEKKWKISNISIFFRFYIEWTIYFLYTLFYHFNFLHIEWWFYSLNWYVYKFYKYLFYLELKYEKEKKHFGNL